MNLKGADKLMSALRAKADPIKVKQVVKVNGSELQRTMQRNASFTQGYQTGATKRSIGLDLTDGGLSASSGPTTDYSPYLIYGTRFMASQDFLRPSYYKQKNVFIDDLKKLVK